MKNLNTHNTRESWLRAAKEELCPYFAKLGYTLPEKIRYAIAFTSGGKRGRMAGECWHADKSKDSHYEIIIRADKDDPVQILSILVKELIHTLLPLDAKHGKAFKAIATRIGLEGKMRQATPSPILRERLNALAVNLGQLPHATLNFMGASDVPKKQSTRLLKAECSAACGYTIRLTDKWAKAGLPVCPVNVEHGLLVCDRPDHGNEEIASDPI